jgi:site-specific DNA-methyltransferase (adenine-specific)
VDALTQILLNADCRAVDPAAVGADVSIFDPPYPPEVHARMTSCAQQGARKGVRQRDAGFDALTEEFRDQLAYAAACTKRWSVCYSALEDIGAWKASFDRRIPCPGQNREGYVRTVIWTRWSSPQQSGDRPPQGSEAVVLAHAPGPMRWGGPGNLTHLEHKALRGEHKHTTEKPLDQALDLVAWFSEPGELVVDWTAGRGTTGVACALLGRRFLGFELQADEAQMGQERIDAAARVAAGADGAGFVFKNDRIRAERWWASLHARVSEYRERGTEADVDLAQRLIDTGDWSQVRTFRKGIPTT